MDVLIEDVAEAFPNPRQGLGRTVAAERRLGADREDPEIVNAIHMVGMFVGVEHGVDSADPGLEQLKPEFRRRVDQ